MFNTEESKRLKKLYASAVIRASLLDYLVIYKGTFKGSIRHFGKHYEDDNVLTWAVAIVEIKLEVEFLHNLDLIEFDQTEGIKLTSKGIEFVEKGIFWDRMKMLATESRAYKLQIRSIYLTIIAALSATVTLLIKLFEMRS